MRLNLAVLAFAAAHASASPLLAWTHPLGLLTLGGESPLDSFATSAATVVFIPGLHTCGTLLVLSAAGVTRADLDDISARGALANEWDSSPSKILEDAAMDEAVVSFAKGWRKSCGKGESMREVRVAKVVVDGLGGEGRTRQDAVENLDTAIQTHLAALPPVPHQHMVILTQLSPISITTLLGIAGGPSTATDTPGGTSAGETSDGISWRVDTHKRHRSRLGLLFSRFVVLALLCAAGWTAYKWVAERRIRRMSKRGGGVVLRDDEELHLDLEAE